MSELEIVEDGPGRSRPAGLRLGTREAASSEVLGFHERFDPWRGRVVLDVDGPGWSIPVDEDYGALRSRLRTRFPDRPFTADWSLQGLFPGLVAGRAPAPMWAFSVAVALGLSWLTALVLGPWVAGVLALGMWWPLGRARASATVDAVGLRLGPSWAPRVPWHEVEAVGAEAVGSGAVRVVARSADGIQEVVLPAILLAPLRARLMRLGGLAVGAVPARLDGMYLRWLAVARGAPWGLLAAGLLAATWFDAPFVVLTITVVLSTAAALVGAAVQARVAGWRNGGIVWMTAAWGVLLLGALLAAAS